MTVGLDGEVALVTGAGRGIGEAVARRLADAGARVAVTSRKAEDAQRIANELGANHFGCGMDVSSSTSIATAAAAICEHMGVPTVLVNNAGVNRIGPTETMTDDDWNAVIDVNLSGVFRCCREVGALMLGEGRGSIINISSIIGTGIAMPWRAPYAASKAGVIGLTQMLAVEWTGRGVRVNAVLPGPTMTLMVEAAINKGVVSKQNVIDRTPAGRFGVPQDIADAVLLLASQESAFVTGQAITVDGGYALWGASHPASRTFDEGADATD